MYIFKTQNVCAKEIHFDIKQNTVEQLRFVGGGCPGNAEALARLAEGQNVQKLLPLLKGIPCREETSCADQFARALELVQKNLLHEAPAVAIAEETDVRSRVAVVADINGDLDALQRCCLAIEAEHVEAVYCLGNQVGTNGSNNEVVERIRKEHWHCVQGPADRKAARQNVGSMSESSDEIAEMKPKNRDHLFTLPVMRVFTLGKRKVLAFYNGFIQDLNGFSDYAPYSTEVILVSGMSEYLTDESVFPALETMTEHFDAQIVLFGHTGETKHVRLGPVDFANVGSLSGSTSGNGSYTILDAEKEDPFITFKYF